MPERILRVRGLEPLLFRDARPFTNDVGGLTARSLPLPLPQTLAGFVRTQVGNAANWDWESPETLDRACEIGVHGPLLSREKGGAETVLLPAPRDALIVVPRGGSAEKPEVFPLRLPSTSVGGSNFPSTDLLPLTVEDRAGKPSGGYAFWPWKTLAKWLATPHDARRKAFGLPEKISGLPREERVHNAIDMSSGRSEDGKLFTVNYAGFEERYGVRWSLLARAHLPQDGALARAGNLGGERRLAEATALLPESHLWPAGAEKASIRDALKGTKLVRLVLATPALFAGGWRPAWEASGELNWDDTGARASVRLRLVAAAVGRREPVSGWDLKSKGPRPVRWMVPAGSVYFFEVLEGDPAALVDNAWLRPVSDDERDRRDGYGLALWGIG